MSVAPAELSPAHAIGTLTASLDGITVLPPRHIATIKSYLAMERPPASAAAPAGLPFTLVRLGGADHARYRTIYATLGARWLWWSRLMLSEIALSEVLADPAIEAYAVVAASGDIGLIELDFREPGVADLAFLGLYEDHTGQGHGARLIGFAKSAVWSRPEVSRMTVNTCTFDSPAALGFYRRHGFAVVAQAVEIVPDPRLSGLLPADAAPHVPMLG